MHYYKSLFFLIFTLTSYSLFGQHKIIDENTVLDSNKLLYGLTITFNQPLFQNAEISIQKNPQIRQLNIENPSQEFLNFVSQHLNELTHLSISNFTSSNLVLPKFEKLEWLSIDSEELSVLSMENSIMNQLEILDIFGPKLIEWRSDKIFPKLGLIDLYAPMLTSFPIENMPDILQFEFYCSFRELPMNLCNYPELVLISFNNFSEIEIPECLLELIKKGVHSNLTVLKGMGGAIIFELLSNDQK